MKHGCKMNTVVSKSFNDRLKIATVSALMAGTFLCLPFTVYAENPLISDVEQTVRNMRWLMPMENLLSELRYS